jgi:hypothetical protein
MSDIQQVIRQANRLWCCSSPCPEKIAQVSTSIMNMIMPPFTFLGAAQRLKSCSKCSSNPFDYSHSIRCKVAANTAVLLCALATLEITLRYSSLVPMMESADLWNFQQFSRDRSVEQGTIPARPCLRPSEFGLRDNSASSLSKYCADV